MYSNTRILELRMEITNNLVAETKCKSLRRILKPLIEKDKVNDEKV